jgi:hypothetical protein
MKAVGYRRPGDPAEVLEVVDVDEPAAPGPRQIRVRVTAFPVHPGDLQAVAAGRDGAGLMVAGVEATGEVLEAGDGVPLTPGTRVTVFLVDGAWREELVLDARLAVPVPDSLSDEVAAQMLINPVTVLMLRRAAQQHVSVGFDGVILNNAAPAAGRNHPPRVQPFPSRPTTACRDHPRPGPLRPGRRRSDGHHPPRTTRPGHRRRASRVADADHCGATRTGATAGTRTSISAQLRPEMSELATTIVGSHTGFRRCRNPDG